MSTANHYHQNADGLSVAIYCGSRVGNNPLYAEHAKRIGRLAAQNDILTVYGDGRAGTMGAVAQAAIDAGGEVQGVTLPFFLAAQGAALPGARPSIIVETMEARMDTMCGLSQAVISLRGAIGTLQENLHAVRNGKQLIIPNGDAYWDGFIEYLEDSVAGGYARPDIFGRIRIDRNAENAIDTFYGLNGKAKRTEKPAQRCAPDNFSDVAGSIVVTPGPLLSMEHALGALVGYDVCSLPKQTVHPENGAIRPFVFVNEGGVFNGLRRQFDRMFDAEFIPQERRILMHFADSVSEAHDVALDLERRGPILPEHLGKKHAEGCEPSV